MKSFYSLLFVLFINTFSYGFPSLELNPKNYVFNLTGSFQGFGDVTGPFRSLLGVKTLRPNENYFVLIDDRAGQVISTIYDEPLTTIEKRLGIKFCHLADAETLPVADVAFELFFGGRMFPIFEGLSPFSNPTFHGEKTITIISDTMHGYTLDQVTGPGFELYFKPPGIGNERSGILVDPELNRIVGKSDPHRRVIAAHYFSDQLLKDLILRSKESETKFSFIYGIHTEHHFKPEFKGQTEKFILEIGKKYPDHTVLAFTPNTKEQINKVAPEFDRILELKDLGSETLEKKVYLLSIPKPTTFQFSSLMSIANAPILVEGNSSISSAIRLGKSFVAYRSNWNAAQIRDLIGVDVQNDKWSYAGVYAEDTKPPNFDVFFREYSGPNTFQENFYSDRIGDFATKLLEVVDLATWRSSADTGILERAESLLSGSKDQYLAYSLVWDAAKRGLIGEECLNLFRKRLSEESYDWRSMEGRFVPNRPNFTEKISYFQNNRIRFQTINLPRSQSRRAKMHKQLLKFPGLNHRFVEAIDGHLVDHEELEDIGIYDSRANLKPGEIGVYLTHLREAAEQAQKSGQITVTFEDDIVLPDNFEEMFRRALSNAPDDWDILYLGCYQNHYADERGVVNNEWSSRFFYPLCPPSALTRVADFWSQMRQRCIAGTWAYVLNQKGAQKLANELIPIQIPIDVRIAELVGQGKLVAYCASPELLSLDGDLPSTIR